MVNCRPALELEAQRFYPPVWYAVQFSDKTLQVSSWLNRSKMQRLENVMLGPYGGDLLIIAIFQTDHGSVVFAPVLTF